MEGGTYVIEVGGSSSSDKLVLSQEVEVREDPRSARGIFTRMTALSRYLKDPVGRELVLGAVKGGRFESWLASEDEMFTAMPIVKVLGFAGFPEEALDAIVAMVNQAGE